MASTKIRRGLATLALLACLAGLSGCPRPDDSVTVHSGPWRAWLDSPGGEIPFGLELSREAGGLQAWLVNGPERIPVKQVEQRAGELLLRIEHYDSRIRATVGDGGARLDGEWTRTSGPGKQTRLAFHATAGAAERFAPPASSTAKATESMDGRWSVRFASEETPAVGIFEAAGDGSVNGTFLTATGDYRYLAGRYDDGRLRLSCFDGAHAFLFDARLQPDGTLSGDFWSRDTWHETWTARRDPEAALLDPFELTTWQGLDLSQAAYPDLDGNLLALDDPRFAGRARLIEIFGSWCPNCNDAALHLAELDRRYRKRGLAILGLAFEMTGDFERDAEQVRKYAAHHKITFPILVAGTSDKEEASAAFPLIDRVRSYPTVIFIDGDQRVRAVYTGYSGPATGPAHQKLRDRFEQLIEQMLRESGA